RRRVITPDIKHSSWRPPRFISGDSIMLTRRDLLKVSAQAAVTVALPSRFLVHAADPEGTEVNDVQSQLNGTRVHEIRKPRSVDDLQIALRDAQRQGRGISLAGGRHAMGTQQFGTDTLHLDTRDFDRVVNFDKASGRITVQAG